ncbi:protein-tyrosine-phosphatase [Sphingobacterium sp. DK4209]|uniref:Protein-tyrosine-phosphatase n=1 Tax=Sphingobacterium zhuxiongii TaxID=2662364 RepID=A0A5Q0QGJ4_9SPHI|nr:MULTISPECIES: protein-tyrosine-phosphatase [unclassified Sphingobacterium]MVZ66588.1 protein-tyrosine-phosphatase [Sphingobacterium sp. DK4209]QGA26772.1 protein-tyrosine-phosphatase [Sphingobacterium sp. dk4302]
MYTKLTEQFQALSKIQTISLERQKLLEPLICYVQDKVMMNKPVNLNFICTHNSRRSHLSQIWAQAASAYFQTPNVNCYSGGTEETALYPKVAETLATQGFHIFKIAENSNPIYAVKYDDNEAPVIAFSKKYDNPFNPVSHFAAILTCSQADNGCPFIAGAEKRIPITYEDPKVADGTAAQSNIYEERSLQIAEEMYYVFSMIKK